MQFQFPGYSKESKLAQQIDCACNTQILSLAYGCEFVGSASCIGIQPTLSDVFGYSFCSNFGAYFATATVSCAPGGFSFLGLIVFRTWKG
jgi:hypothetical protein